MKTRFIVYIIFLLTVYACFPLKRVYRLINQKEKFIWTNIYEDTRYVLIIDNNEGIWFTGRIIIGFKDTLYLKGFEKGNVHPTSVNKGYNGITDSTYLGHIFIDTKGYTGDTVIINNKADSIRQLPINFSLYKSKKQ
ncbi:MAG: hypothetical protein ACK4K0_04260 [Flavobacteriales bacterium]